MVVGGFGDVEFLKDVLDVPLDGFRAEVEAIADAFVGAAFGDQREQLALAVGELVQLAGWLAVVEEPGDDRWVDHAFAFVQASERVGEQREIRDAFFEQVANPGWVLLDQPHCVAGVEVVREDEHSGLWVCGADLVGGDETLVGVGGWHLDVDDRDIGSCELDLAQQLGGIADLAEDLDAGFGEEAFEPFAE